MSINEKSRAYGAQKSSIREISAYANARKAEIGAENVFDFSLGNPSIPAPDAVRASIERALALPATQLHGYTPANGLPADGDIAAFFFYNLRRCAQICHNRVFKLCRTFQFHSFGSFRIYRLCLRWFFRCGFGCFGGTFWFCRRQFCLNGFGVVLA